MNSNATLFGISVQNNLYNVEKSYVLLNFDEKLTLIYSSTLVTGTSFRNVVLLLSVLW